MKCSEVEPILHREGLMSTPLIPLWRFIIFSLIFRLIPWFYTNRLYIFMFYRENVIQTSVMIKQKYQVNIKNKCSRLFTNDYIIKTVLCNVHFQTLSVCGFTAEYLCLLCKNLVFPTWYWLPGLTHLSLYITVSLANQTSLYLK